MFNLNELIKICIQRTIFIFRFCTLFGLIEHNANAFNFIEFKICVDVKK